MDVKFHLLFIDVDQYGDSVADLTMFRCFRQVT
jgi:hypothetical protein